jgi:cell wall-associated NlpC family hydrolase
MSRRRDRVGRGVVVAFAVTVLAVVRPTTASADPIDDQRALVAKVTDHLEALERQSDALGEDYNAALDEQHQLDAEVAAAQQRVIDQETAVGALRAQLAQVAVQAYLGAATSGGNPIFNTTGATDELARDQLSRVATSSGAATTDDYEQALADLRDEQAGLEDARSRAAAKAAQLEADREATERQAADYAKARADAQAKLGDLVQQEEERRARESYLQLQRQAEQAAAAQRAAAEDAAAQQQQDAAAAAAAQQAAAQRATEQAAEQARSVAALAAPSAPAPPPAATAPAPGDPHPTTQPVAPPTTHQRADPPTSATAAPPAVVAVAAPAPPPTPSVPPPSSRASIAINAALSQLGVPYRFAAASPGVAFDCSGLTSWSWAQAGVSLPHQSRAQYGVVAHVPKADAQPGDLLFFYTPISHVSIYLGGGQEVHAPHPGAGVQVASVNWNSVVGVGRPG